MSLLYLFHLCIKLCVTFVFVFVSLLYLYLCRILYLYLCRILYLYLCRFCICISVIFVFVSLIYLCYFCICICVTLAFICNLLQRCDTGRVTLFPVSSPSLTFFKSPVFVSPLNLYLYLCLMYLYLSPVFVFVQFLFRSRGYTFPSFFSIV